MTINPRAGYCAAMLVAMALASGCQDRAQSTGEQSVSNPATKPGPEESFAEIVETFRRGVEDVPIGFVFRDAEGHSMMTGKNEVSHELIRPATDGEPYKAVITVGSQSHYSIQRSTGEEDDASADGNNQRQESAFDDTDETGFEPLDPELVESGSDPATGRKTTPSPSDNLDKKVTRQADRQERKYELVYTDGRWTLVTKLDPETEQSIQNAFKRALDMQI